MPKFDLANYDPTDTHSVNISVYKPDGILSFWNWFTRKNKNSSQHKNIQFKITKEDLARMKLTGIDLQKLRNLDLSNKSKASGRCNVFAVPRADLDPFLKTLHPSVTAKSYVKRLISKSTISVRSKDSCSDIKVVRTIKSQRSVGSSKGSLRTSVVSNTNVHIRSHPQPKSVLLKSVPTTVLKSNTKKLLVLPKAKSPRGQQVTKTNAPGSTTNRTTPRDDSVIPTLLTRMKSMEEHLSEIGSNTKKINDAVSQRNFTSNKIQPSDSVQPERNKIKATKCIAAHKIYSKNIHSPKKNKKRRQKRSQVKSKTNIHPENAPKSEQINKGFAFNYFSDSSNDMKHINEIQHTVNSFSKPGLLLNQKMFSLPNNIKYINLTPENSKDTSCDFIMSVVKALTETKGCTDFYQRDTPTTRNDLQGQQSGSEVNVGSSQFLSKPTFDWKHSSVGNMTESRTAARDEDNEVETAVRQNTTVLLGKPVHSLDETGERHGINPSSGTTIKKQHVFELLKNKNGEIKEQTHRDKEKEHDKEQKHSSPIDTLDNEQSQNQVTQNKPINAEGKNDQTEKENVSNQSCRNVCVTKHSGFGDVKEDYFENGMTNLKDRQSRMSIRNEERHESGEEMQVESHMEDGPQGHDEECEESVPRITLRSGVLCNVSVRQSAASNSPFPVTRTSDAYSEDKKEPKVSITILVQDSMKDKVKMKSSLVTNSRSSKDEYFDESVLKVCPSPLTNFGPKGDQMPILVSNKTKSIHSSENLSSVSCAVSDKELKEPFTKEKDDVIFNSRKKNNFYVEVPSVKEEYLNLGSPGSYLNHEKRKLLDNKVSSSKHKKLSIVKATGSPARISPTRSCSNISNTITSFDQMIEASFITETSYSKTKFNICKEKKYSSRTSLKPMEIYKKIPFSEESITSENNFDISTKFTSQQCVMYCRNNNIKNVRREHFSRYRENFLKPSEVENKKQPFVIVHTPKMVADTSGKTFNSVKRTKVCDSTLREEPILEVSEDESDTCNIKSYPIFEDVDASTIQSITNQCDPNNHHTSRRNQNEDQPSQNSSPQSLKGFKLKKDAADIKCQTKLNEHCNKDVVENGLTIDESQNNTKRINLISCTSKTLLSSMSVQTDWSLVGITVDHFNSTGDKCVSSSCEKRSVANQTDVMMDQIALVGQELEDKIHGCKSCMKSSQFSELVACNANVSRDANLKDNFKELLNSKQEILGKSEDLNQMKIASMLLTMIENQGSNSFESPTEMEHGTLRDDVFEQGLISQFTDETGTLSGKISLETENYTFKPEEIINTTVGERRPHRCTIPCLTTLSDETVRSNLSESGYQNLIINEVSDDYQSVPQVSGINRGIHSYFNTANDQTSSNHSTSVAACRQNKLVFQRVFENLTYNSKDAESQSLYVGKTSEGDKETTEIGLFGGETVASINYPVEFTDNTMQKMEISKHKNNPGVKCRYGKLETQEKIEDITNKNNFSNKPREIESTVNDKCTNFLDNYLNAEFEAQEKKGKSLLTEI